MTALEIEKLTKAKANHPEAGRQTLTRLTGVSRNKAQRFLKGERTVTVPTLVKPAVGATFAGAKKAGRSLAEFRSTYDKSTIVPAKIRAALKVLGANGWEYEVDFGRMAGVSSSDLGNFRDEFSGFVVALKDRRAWAGSVKLAATMREMI
jgi:hypothetical protein